MIAASGMARSAWKRVADRFGRFFGDDIFISHSHRDAAEYAVVLAARLGKRFVAYVDRYSSRPGEEISDEVMNHLMRATMLVVVASPASADHDSLVGAEVEQFAATGRQILAIDVGGALEQCWWKHRVTGLSRPVEDLERLQSARPSVRIRRSVVGAFTYLRRAQKLRHASAAVVAGTLVIAAVLSRQSRFVSALRMSAHGGSLTRHGCPVRFTT